jgi:predicted membrane GTPase involved in stress response
MKKLKNIVYFGLVIAVAGLMCLQAGAITTTPNNKSALPTNLADTLISVDNPMVTIYIHDYVPDQAE